MMVGDSYEDDKVVYLEDDSALAASLRVYTDEEKKHILQVVLLRIYIGFSFRWRRHQVLRKRNMLENPLLL